MIEDRRGDIGPWRVQSVVRVVDGTENFSETEGFREDSGLKTGSEGHREGAEGRRDHGAVEGTEG